MSLSLFNHVGIYGAGVLKNKWIQQFIGSSIHLIGFSAVFFKKKPDFVVIWGRKPSAIRGMHYAKKNKSKICTIEDGFIRSVGLGADGYDALSMVVDFSGIYFDAHQSSDLECLINNGDDQKERALALIEMIQNYELSKYNHAPVVKLVLERKENILVIDQTFGDQSICYSGADAASFQRMLDIAIKNHPDATIWVKTHPEVTSNIKKGHLSGVLVHDNVRLLTDLMNPIALLKQMDEVYVVCSHMGFEALILGKKVHCFGVPWYSGWGLTDDTHATLYILNGRRNVPRSLTQLITAAYFNYARYVNPITEKRCEIEDIIHILIEQKKWNDLLRGRVALVGFSPWKRRFIKDFLKLPSVDLRFFKSFKAVVSEDFDHLVVWGSADIPNTLDHNAKKFWRMEDGFVRSVGLGAFLIRPVSIVLDDVGIYYDSTCASRLDHLLSHIHLSSIKCHEAQLLIEKIVGDGLSKYNVGSVVSSDPWSWVEPERLRILVPGQVEDDASIRMGARDICDNESLLTTVRSAYPDAFIIYKPHPDVVAGLRKGHVNNPVRRQLADIVVTDLAMPICLKYVDQVHTMTSLTGFEALLRGVRVFCYGMPFYAGWGLTVDRHHHNNRVRHLTLEELVYGVFKEYPLYSIQKETSLCAMMDAIEYVATHRNDQLSSVQHALSRLIRFRVKFLGKLKKSRADAKRHT
jgi:capsular polysaccharide export protein